MRLEVLPSLFSQNYVTSTVHFMPYNIQVLHDSCGLIDFIKHAFPELPTTCVHNYEHMKLTEDTLNSYKHKRDD